MVSGLSSPFRFSRWEIERLQARGFYLDSELTKADGWQGTDPDSTIALVFRKHDAFVERDMYVEILLGQCGSGGSHWASVQFHAERPDATRPFLHSCPEDHASEWLHGTRKFQRPQGGDAVCLSLTPCPISPTRTRVVKVSFVDAQDTTSVQ